jgi:hypothetical protein
MHCGRCKGSNAHTLGMKRRLHWHARLRSYKVRIWNWEGYYEMDGGNHVSSYARSWVIHQTKLWPKKQGSMYSVPPSNIRCTINGVATYASHDVSTIMELPCVPLERVLLVTTMWGQVDPAIGGHREEKLRGVWENMRTLGADTTRFDNTIESAWRIVNLLLQ